MKIGQKVKFIIKESNDTFIYNETYTIKSILYHTCNNNGIVDEEIIELEGINCYGNTVCHLCKQDLGGSYFISSMFKPVCKKINNVKIL